MKKIYTTACGTEPYDKNYGIGYKVGHSSWTPYPRVERLMKAFFAKPYDIDLQRLRLVTNNMRTALESSSAPTRSRTFWKMSILRSMTMT